MSAVTYGLVSCWMYVIGMAATMFAGESDITQIVLKTGIGTIGLLIVIFSTVTTTFLDAYSAGVSSEAILKKANVKWIAIGVTVIGTIGAICLPMTDITDFLYFIGSVFAPMIAVQLADFFVVKNDSSDKSFNIQNLVIWFIGFMIYRILMKVDIIIGNTLPDMIVTFLLIITVNKIRNLKKTPQ